MPSHNVKDISGKRFGKLVAITMGEVNSFGMRFWLCKCDCGNTTTVLGQSLRSGSTKSCGCYAKQHARTHGYCGRGKITAEYRAWLAMRNRCSNPSNRDYHNYGGRGIKVCRRWNCMNGFTNFLSDMGPRPSPKHSLERKNNNKGYSPRNCIWATKAEQDRNKRTNRKITYNGKTMILKDWAILLGIDQALLRQRLARGISFKEIAENPGKKYYDRRHIA